MSSEWCYQFSCYVESDSHTCCKPHECEDIIINNSFLAAGCEYTTPQDASCYTVINSYA